MGRPRNFSPACEPEPAKLICCKEAAAMLAISESLAWKMAKRGELPSVRFGKANVRFDPVELWAWIEKHKSGTGQNADNLA